MILTCQQNVRPINIFLLCLLAVLSEGLCAQWENQYLLIRLESFPPASVQLLTL
jgi:hypothetical protein